MRSDNNKMKYLLLLIEFSVTFLLGLMAFVSISTFSSNDELYFSTYIGPSVILAVFVVVFSSACRLYSADAEILSWRTLRSFVIAWVAVVTSIALLAVLFKVNYSYSRVWFISTFVWSFLFCLFFRVLISRYLNRLRKRQFSKLNLLVIGTKDAAARLVDHNRRFEDGWFQTVDIMNWDCSNSTYWLSNLEAKLAEKEYSHVWICGGSSVNSDVRELHARLRTEFVQVKYFPDFSFLPLTLPEVSRQADVPVIDLSASPLPHMDRWLKSLVDRLFSILVLLLGSPLFLVLAIGVKYSSKGPIFYRQERLTLHGKSFMMFKFRSMPVGVENQSGPVWAKKDEKRATRFGQFLRSTSLDELPQFINVLRGEMSVVGPRPERPHFVKEFQQSIPDYMQKHYVKAGITGWAQVNGLRGNTSLEMRVEYDLYYIRNWSIWFDFKIMFLTLFKGLVTETAY